MSLTKSESARINGAKSRGPKTAAGKAKSSRNAIKHGIFAKVIVLSNENADLFEQLTEDFVRRFEPRDGVELAIVEQMVAATWRLSRCWELQTQTMNLEMEKDQDPDNENLKARSFHATIGNSPAMQLLHRFENSYERIINRAIRTLANVRKNFPLPNNDEQKCRNEPKPPSNDSIAQPPDALIQNDPLLTTPPISQNEPNTNQSPGSPVTRLRTCCAARPNAGSCSEFRTLRPLKSGLTCGTCEIDDWLVAQPRISDAAREKNHEQSRRLRFTAEIHDHSRRDRRRADDCAQFGAGPARRSGGAQ